MINRIKRWLKGKPKRVITESELFSPEAIAKIEARYNATYICESCLKSVNGAWADQAVAIFYQPDLDKAPKGASHWFGLYYQNKPLVDIMITNAQAALEPFTGIVADNGDVIYSRYRHDYQTSPDGSVWIDGGREYTRHSGGRLVTLQITKDKVEINPPVQPRKSAMDRL